MDEVLRKLLEKQVKMMPQVREILTEVQFIALKKANLNRIKTGMYWYEDDTVSAVFTLEKKLKSLVLFVEGGVVYGDSFKQRYMLGERIEAYIKALQYDYAKDFQFGLIYRPEVADLLKVYENIAKINVILKRIKKQPWSEDLFWAQQRDNQSASVVDMLDGDDLQMSYESKGAYFRPMIAFMAK